MVGSIKKNFDAQGRPERWAALAVNTLLRRYLRTAAAKKLAEKDKGKARFAGSNALYKRDRGLVARSGVGALSTVAGFARSGRTGRILRSRHRGLNKFAGAGLAFRTAAVRAVLEGKILLDRGFLRSSITGEGGGRGKAPAGFSRGRALVEARRVVIGTNVVYAATHQFGDARRGIPARPFLVVQDEDVLELRDLVRRWLGGAG
jgi:phage gpG-like protein